MHFLIWKVLYVCIDVNRLEIPLLLWAVRTCQEKGAAPYGLVQKGWIPPDPVSAGRETLPAPQLAVWGRGGV